jgi:branched-chain amino acid transport system substrate-binding protein
MRIRIVALALAAVLVGAIPSRSHAADKLKIGFIGTFSGPSAILSQHLYDGFMLGVEEAGGKLGGVPTEVSKNDVQFKPDVARQVAERLIKSDHVDIVTGIIFSNIMMAVYHPVVDSHTILIGSNSGPSPIAGKDGSPYFFSTSWQNDQPHAAVGKFVQDQGVKRVFLVASNYRAGQDAIAGFKSQYKGKIVGEVYPALRQQDYSAEIAQIAASDADATYAFIAGSPAINFVRQYASAGLMKRKTLYTAFMIYEVTLPEIGEIGLGTRSAAFWAPDLDNPVSKAFVAAFRKKYHYMPSMFSAQAYDSARLIDAAVRQVHGKVEDKQALIAALDKADFKSVRGPFRYNNNHFPIQNFYGTEVVKDKSGMLYVHDKGLILKDYADNYAHLCPMK